MNSGLREPTSFITLQNDEGGSPKQLQELSNRPAREKCGLFANFRDFIHSAIRDYAVFGKEPLQECRNYDLTEHDLTTIYIHQSLVKLLKIEWREIT